MKTNRINCRSNPLLALLPRLSTIGPWRTGESTWRGLFVSALFLLGGLPGLGAVEGSYTVKETWTATLTYSNWGDKRFSGTREFKGTQTGTIVLKNGEFKLLNQTGISHEPPVNTERWMNFNGGGYSISGGRVMPYILAGSSLNGILHLSAFMVRVPLVDGEIPTFHNFSSYQTSGGDLSSLAASGNVRGPSLTVTVSSTSVWTRAPFAPEILVQPSDRSVVAGADARFTVVADANPSPSYQWQRRTATSSQWSNVSDGASYGGAGTAELTVKAASLARTGDLFRCRISNSRGSVTSSPATLTVTPPEPPRITSHPQSQTVSQGSGVTLEVTATGPGPLSYQWQKEGVDLPDANSAALTWHRVPAAASGEYRVIVSGPGGTVASESAVLSVNPLLSLPVITTPPASVSIRENHQTANFSVVATGSEPMNFQWRFQGEAIPGATGADLTIPNVTAREAGVYDVVVSNAAGHAISPAVLLAMEVPVVVESIRSDGADGFALQLAFGAGDYLEIEASTDLVEWHSVGQITDQNGLVNYLWKPPGGASLGFMRVRRLESAEAAQAGLANGKGPTLPGRSERK